MTEPALWQTPIADGCFMVGHRRPQSLLQCNTYLRTFRGRERLHWCVDPGSQVDYPVIRKRLQAHVGELAALRLFSINHQDPDVVGNLTLMTRENPHLAGLTSEDTWRLVRHLNLRPQKMYFTNKVARRPSNSPADTAFSSCRRPSAISGARWPTTTRRTRSCSPATCLAA